MMVLSLLPEPQRLSEGDAPPKKERKPRKKAASSAPAPPKKRAGKAAPKRENDFASGPSQSDLLGLGALLLIIALAALCWQWRGGAAVPTSPLGTLAPTLKP